MSKFQFKSSIHRTILTLRLCHFSTVLCSRKNLPVEQIFVLHERTHSVKALQICNECNECILMTKDLEIILLNYYSITAKLVKKCYCLYLRYFAVFTLHSIGAFAKWNIRFERRLAKHIFQVQQLILLESVRLDL